jgi:hypothetical protein
LAGALQGWLNASIRVPSFVQEGWAHPSAKHLYLTTSNRGPGLKGNMNHVSAYRIDVATGGLTPDGLPKPLPHRAVNVCLDPSGSYAINAHNLPKSGLTIHSINRDVELESASKAKWTGHPRVQL